jgi:hypothetical protein
MRRKETAPVKIVKTLFSKRYNANNLMPVLKATRPTIQRKLKNPSLLTLGDIQDLVDGGAITIEEVVRSYGGQV